LYVCAHLPRFSDVSDSEGAIKMEMNEKITSNFSPEDIQRAREFYVCFDRPAFRQNFEAHTDIEALMAAIDDTIAAINTGVLKRRDGVTFGTPVKGRAYFDSHYLKKAFGTLVDLLSEVKNTYLNAKNSGYFFDLSSIGRSGLAFHQNYQDEAINVAVVIDDLRNKTLRIANEVYAHLGIPPFPYIKTPEHYSKLASRFDAVMEILEVKPSVFGIGVDFGKLMKKLFRKKPKC
jgi:hypothetical protein